MRPSGRPWKGSQAPFSAGVCLDLARRNTCQASLGTYKPTTTRPSHKMKRRRYFGTCTIKYFDVSLLLNLVGLYEAFAQKYGRVAESV